MINLKEIIKSNLISIIKLSVKTKRTWLHQIQYLKLIIQIRHGSGGIFYDDIAVGFVMLDLKKKK